MTAKFRFILYAIFILVIAVSCTKISKVYAEGLVTGQPGMNVYTSSQPGETEKLERPYEIAPPLVPHDIVDFEISRSANDCLECHYDGLEDEHGVYIATKAPPSHYINEYSKEQTKEQVIGIRYLCLQCHVPQTVEQQSNRAIEQ